MDAEEDHDDFGGGGDDGTGLVSAEMMGGVNIVNDERPFIVDMDWKQRNTPASVAAAREKPRETLHSEIPLRARVATMVRPMCTCGRNLQYLAEKFATQIKTLLLPASLVPAAMTAFGVRYKLRACCLLEFNAPLYFVIGSTDANPIFINATSDSNKMPKLPVNAEPSALYAFSDFSQSKRPPLTADELLLPAAGGSGALPQPPLGHAAAAAAAVTGMWPGGGWPNPAGVVTTAAGPALYPAAAPYAVAAAAAAAAPYQPPYQQQQP